MAPMTYYVVGAARRLGGWTPDALTRRTISTGCSREPCRRKSSGARPDGMGTPVGLRPPPWSASTRASLSSPGPPAGPPRTCWLGLVLASPYFREALRRAMNEGVLLAALAVSIWSTFRLLAELDRPRAQWRQGRLAGWLVLAGGAAGLAAQTKLNGAVAGLARAGRHGPGRGALSDVRQAPRRIPDARRRHPGGVRHRCLLRLESDALAVSASGDRQSPPGAQATDDGPDHARRGRRAADDGRPHQGDSEARVSRFRAGADRVGQHVAHALAGGMITIRHVRRWLSRQNDNHAVVALGRHRRGCQRAGLSDLARLEPGPPSPGDLLGFPTVMAADWLARRAWQSLRAARARL